MSSLRVVKWGDGLISTTRPGSAPRLKHLLPIREPLEWGPQHVDLVTQQLLRCCYHRWPLAAAPDFGAYCQALLDGELHFWCDPVLRSFLGIAWVLEVIGDRGANLSNAFLVLSPGRSEFERFDPERIEQAFEKRIPVPGVFGALVATRRHLASDSNAISVDLSLFPEPLRAWAAAAQRLEDFLPDQNGLDIVDRMLLDRLMAERSSGNAWPNAAMIFGWADCHPDGHYIGEGQMWERLMQLSGVSLTEPQSYGRRSSWLVEAQFEGQATRSGSRFTLTALGDQVVGGGVDVLPSCPFTRWVGGREVSRYRQLRR